MFKTIKNAITNTIDKTIRNAFTLLSRYFVTLDNILNSIYIMSTPIVLSGDFEYEVEISTTYGQYGMIFGNNSVGGYIAVNPQGGIKLQLATNINSTIYVRDGKLHKIKVTRVSGVVKLFIDGVLDGTFNDTNPVNINRIGTWNLGGLYFKGIIANAKFTDKSGASDVVTTFKLGNSPAAVNYIFSAEKIANNTFANGTTDWASVNSNSSLSIVNNNLVSTAATTANFGVVQQVDNLTIGSTYVFKGQATCSNSSATVKIRIGTNSLLSANIYNAQGTGNVTVDHIFVATATTHWFGTVIQNHAANDTVTIPSGITVKEITNYTAANSASETEASLESNNTVTYTNIPQAARDLYTLTDNIWTDAAGNTIEVAAFTELSVAAPRTFVTLDDVLNSYYTMGTSITLSGDFEMEVEVSTTTTSTYNIIAGNSSSGTTFLTLANTGVFRISIGSGTALNGTIAINDGKLHKCKVVRVSGVVSMFVDGVADGSYTNTNTAVFNTIGRWNVNSYFFDGIIANFKFTDKSGASDVVTTFNLDQATANTESSIESNNTVTYSNIPQSARDFYSLEDDTWTSSDEVVVNGDFSNNLSSWSETKVNQITTVVNGACVIDSNGSSDSGITQNLAFTIGKTYMLTFDVQFLSNFAAKRLTIYDGSYYNIINIIDGKQEIVIKPTTGYFAIRGTNVQTGYNAIFSIDNVSVKEIIEVAP